jgi:hypothetical protein
VPVDERRELRGSAIRQGPSAHPHRLFLAVVLPDDAVVLPDDAAWVGPDLRLHLPFPFAPGGPDAGPTGDKRTVLDLRAGWKGCLVSGTLRRGEPWTYPRQAVEPRPLRDHEGCGAASQAKGRGGDRSRSRTSSTSWSSSRGAWSSSRGAWPSSRGAWSSSRGAEPADEGARAGVGHWVSASGGGGG